MGIEPIAQIISRIVRSWTAGAEMEQAVGQKSKNPTGWLV